MQDAGELGYEICRGAFARLAAALALAAGCAVGRPDVAMAPPQQPASIPFVSLGGIRNWHAQDDSTLLVQGAQGAWYRATFFGHCVGLRDKIELAFVTDGMNELDRFSSVLVDGQRCWFRSFERVEPEDAVPEQPE